MGIIDMVLGPLDKRRWRGERDITYDRWTEQVRSLVPYQQKKTVE